MDDWDLQAVVRGCRGAAATRDPFSWLDVGGFVKVEEVVGLGAGGDVGGGGGGGGGLLELCRPFIRRSHQQQQQQQQPITMSAERERVCSSHFAAAAADNRGGCGVVRGVQRPRQSSGQNPRAKKRKNQQKRVVCEVPADGVSADLWAWRKYGQKPIKGSPYPRGYYRCSSLKGCPARKQVERNPKDPSLLMITYTAEHNHAVPTHRNSLAGSTRGQKLTSSAHGGLSPTTPLSDDLLHSPHRPCKSEEAESDELLVEDMEVMGEDDFSFLSGQVELTSPTLFDGDHSPWLTSNSIVGGKKRVES